MEPYTPPSVWLKATQSSGEVWSSSWKWIKDDETSISSTLFKGTPALMDPALMFNVKNRKGLNHLLRANREDDATQFENPDIVSAYETTVSYIGGIKQAISNGEPRIHIMRRLSTFPMWINRNFPRLVEERQPRALVILSYYFALLTMFKDVWYIADTGEREIRALSKNVPPKWLLLMEWPMRALDEPALLLSGTIEDSMDIPEDIDVGIPTENDLSGGSNDFIKPFGRGFRGENTSG
jgi:hypothetical protein